MYSVIDRNNQASKDLKNKINKEVQEMNASAMKPKLPFVAKSTLSRAPASEDNKKITEFINSHDFSFDIDSNGKLISIVTDKRE